MINKKQFDGSSVLKGDISGKMKESIKAYQEQIENHICIHEKPLKITLLPPSENSHQCTICGSDAIFKAVAQGVIGEKKISYKAGRKIFYLCADHCKSEEDRVVLCNCEDIPFLFGVCNYLTKKTDCLNFHSVDNNSKKKKKAQSVSLAMSKEGREDFFQCPNCVYIQDKVLNTLENESKKHICSVCSREAKWVIKVRDNHTFLCEEHKETDILCRGSKSPLPAPCVMFMTSDYCILKK